jgi:hypothetical protein
MMGVGRTPLLDRSRSSARQAPSRPSSSWVGSIGTSLFCTAAPHSPFFPTIQPAMQPSRGSNHPKLPAKAIGHLTDSERSATDFFRAPFGS